MWFVKLIMNKRFVVNWNRVMARFYYIKLCYYRAFQYVGIPIQVFSFYMIASLWLKSRGFTNDAFIIGLFIFIMLAALGWGHMDIKYKLAHLEMSINNQVNPELMSILANTKSKEDDDELMSILTNTNGEDENNG